MKVASPLLFSLALALPLCAAPTAPSYPLLEGLGAHTRPITTASPEAQRYFDQGLNLLFGFNHDSSLKSFRAALACDPDCAMAQWGVALASGPDINSPNLTAEAAARAVDAIAAARIAAQKNATPLERALIEALAKRYVVPEPENRAALNEAYADALRALWRAHPNDADLGAMFAEAMLDLRPWDQWTADGRPQPGTEEIVATLDAVLRLDANHPLANHLYVHALEGSAQPERAVAAANRLRHLQPLLSHNMHMPSHIDVRVGLWNEAVSTNQRALAADQRLRALEGAPEGGTLLYSLHNHHMLAYAALMTGQRALAVEHARHVVDILTPLVATRPKLESRCALVYEVLARFGLWDDILAAPDHPESMPFTRAMRHAARGIAFAAKGEPALARLEQQRFAELAAKIPDAQLPGGTNTSGKVLAVMTAMLDGEILVREGQLEPGLARLRDAVQAEDALRYDEPPNWLLPVRHALGATLMTRGRFAEAEQVYRDDLKRLPNNGWSLFGLMRSLQLQKKNPTESAALERQFKTVWANADLSLTSSCLCQPGA